ncbi:hypothetical protein GGD61_000237 [Bradyrhizobium sp. SBR1B]|nr:hypothetical protein [Bradyrhizobium sp. SBR1B]
MTPSAAEIASRIIGARVFVQEVRDPSDGSTTFAVVYGSEARRWTSRHRFDEVDQANAAATVLADWLCAEVR